MFLICFLYVSSFLYVSTNSYFEFSRSAATSFGFDAKLLFVFTKDLNVMRQTKRRVMLSHAHRARKEGDDTHRYM